MHVDSSGHLIRQTLVLTDGPATPPSLPSSSNSSTNLPLPNPFKALKAVKSSENLVADAKADNLGRIHLSDALDLGLLPLMGPISRLRFTIRGNTLRGYAWSTVELSVSTVVTAGLSYLER